MKGNEEMIVAVKRNLCNCVKKPEKKNSGLQNPWPRDYQCDGLPNYEATDIGSWSIVGSYVPVKEVSVNDIWNKSYMNAEKEMKWRNNRRSEMQFMQLRKEAWKKIQDFNRVWTHDLVITGAMVYQLTELWSHWC